jgi:hypothetical protein
VLIIKREADIIQCRLLAAPKQGLVDREGGDTHLLAGSTCLRFMDFPQGRKG